MHFSLDYNYKNKIIRKKQQLVEWILEWTGVTVMHIRRTLPLSLSPCGKLHLVDELLREVLQMMMSRESWAAVDDGDAAAFEVMPEITMCPLSVT